MNQPPQIPPMQPMQPLAYATPTGAGPMPIHFEGDVLVTPAMVDLGQQCVKCSQMGVKRIKKTMYWMHPALGLLFFTGVLILLIVHLIVRKKTVFTFSLCQEHAAKRRNGLLIGWGMAALGLALIVGGIALASKRGATSMEGTLSLLGILGGIITMVASLVVGSMLGRAVWPKRVDNTTAWLKGINVATFNIVGEAPTYGFPVGPAVHR